MYKIPSNKKKTARLLTFLVGWDLIEGLGLRKLQRKSIPVYTVAVRGSFVIFEILQERGLDSDM